MNDFYVRRLKYRFCALHLPMIDLLIKNGTVVGPGYVAKMDVAIDDGRILSISAVGSETNAESTINADGQIVIPGGIDPHTHIELEFPGGERSPEDWGVASRAAAIGGTTMVSDFAFQEKGKPLMDAVRKQFERAKKMSAIDYSTKPIISDFSDLQKVLQYMKEVVDYGLPGFKTFMTYRKQGWYANDWDVFSVLRRSHELGCFMSLHCENGPIEDGLTDELIGQGKTQAIYHAHAHPSMLENMSIQSAMIMAEATGANTYLVHVSTKEGPWIADDYRRRGVKVTVETCAHYLTKTEQSYEDPKMGIYPRVKPPLRKKEDVEAMWMHIFQGRVQTIGSDHAVFTKNQKERNAARWIDVPTGFPGVEVRLPMMYSEGVVKRKLSLTRFVELVSTNPAKLLGIYPRKGVLMAGSDADVVIIDPKRKHSLDADKLHYGVDLSIYEGMQTNGWPATTILGGKVITSGDEYLGKPGDGKPIKSGPLDWPWIGQPA